MDKIHVIIPNYKESNLTIKIVKDIKSSSISNNIQIIIVDSSPTDFWMENMKKELQSISKVKFIKVPSQYFWSRTIKSGIGFIKDELDEFDFIILLNNDVTLSEKYIEFGVQVVKAFDYDCFVSGYTLESDLEETFFEAGLMVDKNRLSINSYKVKINKSSEKQQLFYPDALSARALIMPAKYFMRYSFYLNAFFLPHYWADLYLTSLAKNRGYNLVVSDLLEISHANIPSVKNVGGNVFFRYFAVKSPKRIISFIYFWLFKWVGK